jgi:hypothetical protein
MRGSAAPSLTCPPSDWERQNSRVFREPWAVQVWHDHLPHACLQTSCWEEQLSVHDGLIVGVEAMAPPEGFGLTAGPTAKQELWQLIAAMSQLFAHAVVFGPAINGVGVRGVGVI